MWRRRPRAQKNYRGNPSPRDSESPRNISVPSPRQILAAGFCTYRNGIATRLSKRTADTGRRHARRSAHACTSTCVGRHRREATAEPPAGSLQRTRDSDRTATRCIRSPRHLIGWPSAGDLIGRLGLRPERPGQALPKARPIRPPGPGRHSPPLSPFPPEASPRPPCGSPPRPARPATRATPGSPALPPCARASSGTAPTRRRTHARTHRAAPVIPPQIRRWEK